VNAPPFACPFCGEERLLEGDARAWMCQVCGQHGPRAGAAPELPYVRAVAGHTAVHYGNAEAVECGAESPFRYSHRPEDVTCRTCRGWLPIVAPRAAEPPPASTDALQALIAALVQRHLPGQWQVVAVAPLTQWPRSLQRELTQTLGALTDTVVLVLERMPS
jgi:hypothetical protein